MPVWCFRHAALVQWDTLSEHWYFWCSVTCLSVCLFFFARESWERQISLSLTLSLFAILYLNPHTHTPCMWLRVSMWVCAVVCMSCDARQSPYGWLPDPSVPLGPERTSAARGCDLGACWGHSGGQRGQALQAHYCRKLKTQSPAQTQVACALTPFVGPNCAVIKTNLEEDGASAWGKRKVREKWAEETDHHISHAMKQSHSVKLCKCVCVWEGNPFVLCFFSFFFPSFSSVMFPFLLWLVFGCFFGGLGGGVSLYWVLAEG